MTDRYRATWASRGSLLLPLAARSISTGVWVYGSTSRAAVLANQLTGRLASLRIGLVPGKNVRWDPPIEHASLRDWLPQAGDALGRRVVSWVAQLPTDNRRRRFNLLLLDSSRTPVGFAKFTRNRPNPMSLAALARFAETPTRSFWSPGLALADQLEEYSVVLTFPMPNRPHRPSVLSFARRRTILMEIRDRLDDLAAPGVAVHGDFAPWNVRTFGDDGVAVVDWEEVTSGVVGADELWYAACSRALAGRRSKQAFEKIIETSSYSRDEVSEAAKFLIDRLNQKEPDEIDSEKPMPPKLDEFSRLLRSILEAVAQES